MSMRGHEQECNHEGKLHVVKTEMSSMSNELSTLRSRVITPEADPLIQQKCRTLAKGARRAPCLSEGRGRTAGCAPARGGCPHT